VHAVRNQKSFARLGIIVGKRTVQHAVARNFLKRLIRETFRTRQRELAGYDLLVRIREAVRPADAKASQVELAAVLTSLLK
jgi:ribonuclease P protein component